MATIERENLFTKKAEKEFFKLAEDEAAAQGKKAVLLKGFDNNEKNMLIDERAYKIKQASREHTIIVRLDLFRCLDQGASSGCLCGLLSEPGHAAPGFGNPV